MHIAKARLIDANLGGAHLEQANLSGDDMEQANLSDAVLAITNLSDAVLVRANLSHAHFSSANLVNANLGGANLRHAQGRAQHNHPAKRPSAIWLIHRNADFLRRPSRDAPTTLRKSRGTRTRTPLDQPPGRI